MQRGEKAGERVAMKICNFVKEYLFFLIVDIENAFRCVFIQPSHCLGLEKLYALEELDLSYNALMEVMKELRKGYL